MSNIIVTGASGAIGSALIKEFLSKDDYIYAVVRPVSCNIGRLPKGENIEVIQCDITDYCRLPEMISEKCDIFYHFAWTRNGENGEKNRNDAKWLCKNIGYTLDAFQAAYNLGCTNFVAAGSQAEYGTKRKEVQSPDDKIAPDTPYGIIKDTIHKLLALKAQEYGMYLQWVRIFSIYGLHDRKGTMVSGCLDKMIKGEHISLTECRQQWEYLYDEDAAKALYLIGKKAKGSNVFCLGSGEAVPLKKYVEIMAEVTDYKREIGYGEIPYHDKTVMNLHADIDNLLDLGWKPQTSFADGIRNIVNHKMADNV